ncbi:hypothetical protein TSAR_005571 [Trichomalopsis sarcophagae]|uniref:RNA (guanine-9-)-methyltransferase domain-containing protein 1 n=1 Tax=Trichomalopsis sarcophagae TaxID=543379 RepID=A0A232F7V2_9HYME|nr:hypothetical protein TSAR_005571 [Trichomalopsis sarcophagae]
MYSRVLRTVLNVSTKLKNQKIYKNAGLSLPAATLIAQKVLPTYGTTVQHFSDDRIKDNLLLAKDGSKRKNQIDERAQAKLNDMIAEKPELEKLMKILELEIDVLRQNGENVPSSLRPRDWLELVQLSNISKRKKYLDYLFVIEKQQEKRKQEQEENNIKLEQVREERKNKVQDPNEIIYSIGNNSMFRRFVERTMNQLWNWNCLRSIMYGNKIVFDCSYEPYMKPQEIKSCAKQIMESFAINRVHNYPFVIYLCNANLSGPLIERLTRFMPTLFDDDFPMVVTSKSYLELFGRDSIVYLTSNAPKMLETFDPDSVYIIGAYVDKGSKQPVSLGKAKKENVRMAKLPIDKYVQFGDGSGKDLTLNQVMGIMLDAQTGDWEKAMLHVPRRKTYEARMYSLEKKLQRDISYRTRKLEEEGVEGYKSTRPVIQSSGVNDYSHAARAKLREQWNK